MSSAPDNKVTPQELLSVTHLRKSFSSPKGERIEVLRDVTFGAKSGEAIAIVGASGAGKSTLLHLLGGLEAPEGGNIELEGIRLGDVGGNVVARLRNSKIGFVFQFHHLLPDFTAVENVAMPLIIAGMTRREAMIKASTALSRIGLNDRSADFVNYLSGGEQQRVAVARALINEPVLVLADEPTGNLDAAIEGEIAAELMARARLGRGTVLLATHNDRLAAACDRVLLLKDGVLEHV